VSRSFVYYEFSSDTWLAKASNSVRASRGCLWNMGFVESSFKSSFELLDFLLDDFL